MKNIYENIDRFIKELEEKGCVNFAEDVQNAKYSGSMDSEILGLILESIGENIEQVNRDIKLKQSTNDLIKNY